MDQKTLKLKIMQYTLTNGIKIPKIGFGTWQIPNGEDAYNAVKEALSVGYTHIDTAAVYKNEESVGKAIKDSNIEREKLFVTTKLWNTERGYDNTLAAFQKSLDTLQMDYVDLYLIHWPAIESQFDNWNELNVETWKAMEEIYRQKKAKAIGVSNFLPHHLKGILESASVMPTVNQIEFHPGYLQKDTVQFCKNEKILIEAWSPLGSGRLLNDEKLGRIAEKYGISVPQLCISFVLQSGHLPLPKSVTPKNIKANLLDEPTILEEEDFREIVQMEEAGFSGLNPDSVDF